MKLSDLTFRMIAVAEKAAAIARAVRSEHALFELLVEKKTGFAKNNRFVDDFKTLADVLIQEMVRHDLSGRFPGLKDHICGEESNSFENKLGESVAVEIKSTEDETCSLLVKVLNGNLDAAVLLAQLVHQDVTIAMDSDLATVDAEVSVEDIGIWIDPIDGTAQYVNGTEGVSAGSGLYHSGLPCVVILIGAFHKTTGHPIAGVINQPFARRNTTTDQWAERCLWGISYDGTNKHNVVPPLTRAVPPILSLVLSGSEDSHIQSKLGNDFSLTHACGAGYKMLCVIDGVSSGYVLTKGSTFKWDSCAPHAILRSMGGGIVNLNEVLKATKQLAGDKTDVQIACTMEECQVRYHMPDSTCLNLGQRWSNTGGIIAYQQVALLKRLLDKLS